MKNSEIKEHLERQLQGLSEMFKNDLLPINYKLEIVEKSCLLAEMLNKINRQMLSD